MKPQDSLSVQLAETLMKRYPHPDNYPFRSWCYPQGFLLQGFIRLYQDTGEACYRDYVLAFAQHHVSPQGALYRFQGNSMDDMMAGSILCWALQQTGEPRYRTACNAILASFSDYPRNRCGGFLHSRRGLSGQMWVDGVFMGGMFLLGYAQYVDDTAGCTEEVIRQLDCIFQCCHKQGGLLYHAWSEDPQTVWANPETGCSSDVWSEGLGWYALILTELVRQLPQTHPAYLPMRQRLTMLLDSLCTLQGSDGLWYQVVDKPRGEDNWTDTSGSAMFTYALAETARLFPEKDTAYRKAAENAMKGLRRRAVRNEKGFIDILHACDGLCVQKSYEDYVHYPQRVNAKEAVAAVLWAAETMERESLSSPHR